MHPLKAAAAALLAALVVLMAFAPTAGADGMGGAATDDSGIDYGALAGGGSSAGRNASNSGGSRGGSNGPSCDYRLMGGPENFPVYDVDGTLIETTSGGAWYEKTCDGVFFGAVYLRGAPDAPAAPDPVVIAAGVLRRMTIPTPAVASSPASEQVVNLPSWLWIENWETLTGTASVGGVTVTVTARPTSARWTFGDGSSSICGPGVPWSATASPNRACTHTWTRSSAAQPSQTYRLGVSVTWSASYSVTGGAGGGALESITRTTTVPVSVAEVQAINNRVGG